MAQRNDQDHAIVPYGQQAVSLISKAAVGLGSAALYLFKLWWSAIRESHPWSIYQAAKIGDDHQLQALLSKAPRSEPALAEWRRSFLEYEDIISGWTPLMAAASGGAANCVQLLLTAGADHTHADRWGRTPLHLAVSAAEHGVAGAQSLLLAGADPWSEDIKGYTSYDLALNNDASNEANVRLVRSIEQRALFAGSLNIKVVKFAGFRRIWEPRWAVISPRRHSTAMRAQSSGSFLSLTWFQSKTNFTVLGKVWLNGAEAAVAERDGVSELTLTLQRAHERPSDAFVVTDRAMRHSIFLRAPDPEPTAPAVLDRIVRLVGGAAATGTGEASTGQPGAAFNGTPAATDQTGADEALAQRLQEEEYSRAAVGDRSGQVAASDEQGRLTEVEEQPQPSAPSWPAWDGGLAPDGTGEAGPSTASAPAQGRVPGPDVSAGYVRPRGPPATAPHSNPSPSPAGMISDEGNLCVICSDRPAEAGFLHGSSLHKCVCKECAEIYRRPGGPKTCPMCRANIQQVVLSIY